VIEDEDLKDFVLWSWCTGMRKGETAKLSWEMFDRESRTIRLHSSAAKTRTGRLLAIDGPLEIIMERRIARRRLDCPTIFHREGLPIEQFRHAWLAAVAKANLPGVLFHDLRRSAIRNLMRAGVHESVAMRISGHRTRAIFDRYNIVDEDDIRAAVIRTAAFVESLPTERKVVSIEPATLAAETSKVRKSGRRGRPSI